MLLQRHAIQEVITELAGAEASQGQEEEAAQHLEIYSYSIVEDCEL